MRSIVIQSTDKNASINIERREYEQFTNYAITGSFDSERVANEGVVFTGTAAFLQALEAFDRSRAGSAILEGTEDCQLKIEADGKSGHAWLTFVVARTIYASSPQTGRSKSGRIVLSGSFPVAGEFIGQLVRDFSQLFKPYETPSAE